jgi:hypothetical protein
MIKLSIVAVSILIGAGTALGGKYPVIACAVLNSEGEAVQVLQRFSYTNKCCRAVKIGSDGQLNFMYPMGSDRMSVSLDRNPYYPFQPPFSKEYQRTVMYQGYDGLIEGELSLSPVLPGFKLRCEQEK